MTDSSAPKLSLFQLSACSGVSPFALVVVAPMLPELRTVFDESEVRLQYIVSAYLLGLALAQSILGPLSDKYGRKQVLSLSLLVYAAASLACALSLTLDVLIAARFVQACGAAGTAALCRAMVHDVHEGDVAARYMAYIAMATSIAHSIAPLVGGYAADVVGWRGVFYSLAILGAVMFAWTALSLPETRSPSKRTHMGVHKLLLNNALMMKSPLFLTYTLIYGLTAAPFFAFLGVAPAFFADRLSITGAEFGLYWSYMAVSFLLGALLSARLIPKLGRSALVRIAAVAIVLLGVAQPAVLIVFDISVFWMIAPLVVLSLALGMAQPIALSGAIGQFPDMAGTASGLCGTLIMVLASIMTVLSAAVYDGTAISLMSPISLTMIVIGGLYALSLKLESLKLTER